MRGDRRDGGDGDPNDARATAPTDAATRCSGRSKRSRAPGVDATTLRNLLPAGRASARRRAGERARARACDTFFC